MTLTTRDNCPCDSCPHLGRCVLIELRSSVNKVALCAECLHLAGLVLSDQIPQAIAADRRVNRRRGYR